MLSISISPKTNLYNIPIPPLMLSANYCYQKETVTNVYYKNLLETKEFFSVNIFKSY